jgi:transcriptional regulator of arginine metabolism
MNKRQRQYLIRQILRDSRVTNQQDLVAALAEEECEVTQATVSRDLREMGLQKGRDSGGRVQYMVVPVVEERPDPQAACARMLKEFGRGLEMGQNLLVLRCDPGAAPSMGRVIDELEHDSILGCVAGDDTVIVVCRDLPSAVAVHQYLKELGG